MTGPKARDDAKLIDLFLSVYEDREWAGDRSHKASPETEIDGGIDLLATRISDGQLLAIEHTLIEPFPGERDDYFKHFEELQQRLRMDEALLVPGMMIHVSFPEGALPRGSDWKRIGDDVVSWLLANVASFTDEPSTMRCPCRHHPGGELQLQVRAQPLGDASRRFLIVQRYGPMRLGESVEKALRRKLLKLVKQPADRRILLLERDQGWVMPDEIYSEIERLRPQFPQLEKVDEIWIADTASFEPKGRYASFRHAQAGTHVETFSFYDGTLFERFKDGMPIPC